MQIILVDDALQHKCLLPLSFLKSIADLRVGILTIKEKWAHYSKHPIVVYAKQYIAYKYEDTQLDEKIGHYLYINSSLLPDEEWLDKLNKQKEEVSYLNKEGTWMFLISKQQFKNRDEVEKHAASIPKAVFEAPLLTRTWEIFQWNALELQKDFKLITKNRESEAISDPHTIVYGQHQVFVEKGAKIRAAILNAEEGPIYIGKNAQIHEGAIIGANTAICDSAHVNPGAKIKGDSTIGPYCKVGGELGNVVFQSYSNKGHDGYLGNAVIGSWCNLGADTNCSNLKNNYSKVKVWDYVNQEMIKTDMQFCGLIMGDHSKCGINTMFNTATTIGVAANVFGGDFPPKFIPDFTWGGPGYGYSDFKIEKVIEMAEAMMKRRKVVLSEQDKAVMKRVMDDTDPLRYEFYLKENKEA